MMSELPHERLSNEEYAASMIEQARICAELEASNRRIQAIIKQAMSEGHNE